jgi:hypothetical protein
MPNNMLNMYSNQMYNSFGSGYRSMPVETPYSGSALALQGGRYPATSLAVPNEMAYPVPYTLRYSGSGTYGQRGLLPAPMF